MALTYSRHVDSDNLAYCNGGPFRVLRLVGEDSFGFRQDFTKIDVAADVIPGWTCGLVETGSGESTVTLDTASGGHLILTTDDLENDGINCQMDGEAFEMTTDQRLLYFGTKFQASEAVEADFLVGLCITDGDLLSGPSDGCYFEKLDDGTGISFVTEKGNTETQTDSLFTFAKDIDTTLEFYWDGATVHALINGVVVAKHTTNLPDDDELTPSIHFLAGDGNARTMTIDWVSAWQVGR